MIREIDTGNQCPGLYKREMQIGPLPVREDATPAQTTERAMIIEECGKHRLVGSMAKTRLRALRVAAVLW